MTTNIPAPVFNEFSIESANQLLSTKLVSQDLVDKMNALASSTELAQTFKDNMTSFTTVLNKGAFTLDQYVTAVQYVSYRLMGHGVRISWEKTFPERYARLLSLGTNHRAINSHSTAFNRTKLVNLITEQSLIPSWIINNHYFQEALDVQVGLMRDEDVSPKVRSDAAKAVLEYTVMPDAAVGNKEEISDKGMDIIAELARSVTALAEGKQARIIEGSATAQEMARKPVYAVEAEIIDE